MSQKITLNAADGHALSAWRADPASAPKGGIVLLHAVYGLTDHMADVCDGFAGRGYAAIAPALYDRSSKRGVDLGYTADDMTEGRQYREEFSWDDSVRDIQAAVALMQADGLKVGTTGYCWGGTISYLAGCRLDVQAAVVYYGGQIIPYVEETANCPMLMHFGEHDKSIPLSDVDIIRGAHADAAIHVYDADHGFSCDHRGQYNAAAAIQARERTMAFYAQNLS